MNKLTHLYRSIQEENIYLDNHHIESHKAVSINIIDKYCIFVDYQKITSLEDEFRVLAHEYGHCVSGTTHHLHSPYETISRYEYRADKCAVHKFLPIDTLTNAIKQGYTELWELSEFFNLPEDFIEMADYVYKREGLLYG